MNHRIGTVDLPPRIGPSRYFAELTVLELSATCAAPLNARARTRWKTEAPAGSLALAAPWIATHKKPPPNARGYAADPGAGELRDSPAVRAALQEFGATCVELSAWAAVFPSPPLLSPSVANRERLTRFFAEVAPAELFGGAQRVWIPDGLWEPLAAVRFAQQLGVTCAVDPLVTIPGAPPDLHLHYEAESLYFRFGGLGRSRGLREEDLLAIEELATYYPDASFVFASMERWKDAKNTAQRLSEEITEVDPMAGGRRRPGEELAFQRPPKRALAAEVDDAAVTQELATEQWDGGGLDEDDEDLEGDEEFEDDEDLDEDDELEDDEDLDEDDELEDDDEDDLEQTKDRGKP